MVEDDNKTPDFIKIGASRTAFSIGANLIRFFINSYETILNLDEYAKTIMEKINRINSYMKSLLGVDITAEKVDDGVVKKLTNDKTFIELYWEVLDSLSELVARVSSPEIFQKNAELVLYLISLLSMTLRKAVTVGHDVSRSR